MSYCNKCYQLYANQWQSDRCCSYEPYQFLKLQQEKKRKYNNYKNTNNLYDYNPNRYEDKICAYFAVLLIIMWIILINPYLGGFILILYIIYKY